MLHPGLNVEGLYRMGGQTEEVMKIKADFDRGEYPTLSSLLCVASTLCCEAVAVSDSVCFVVQHDRCVVSTM